MYFVDNYYNCLRIGEDVDGSNEMEINKTYFYRIKTFKEEMGEKRC